ncbi:glycerophosphoryl diester phosphodiesterase [Agromyces flavus]|uniref:glycerophosphodiester phosphodiesterase n=1 Tax=Agromyces flavus TaxID=589382 RepID=A0A1H1LUV1_9MICO|nr:glycerophosphodiester phosphodiesterase family protein [Agromyces flavus]MCP2368639.1 glycerophosphoryl diester phosphodiesterase [Agromyces flavus]GGI48121.1 glycerophosphoryl diester phosphodiesterase [Agromyces flavus]SDR78283.1 glycerophosphoryl diester phosphodiesterase [Agromyces flavus]
MQAGPAERPLVIGHRGAPGYRPEHTEASYRLAFALGVDAVEPDLVATRDGVLVLRHENEISGTTDVASRPEFASRRTTREVDGKALTGWFTEDFTWAELSTLRATERLGGVRQHSATFDGRYPIIRFRDLLTLLDAASDDSGRDIRLVAEFKHATHFAGLGLPLDELFAAELTAGGWGRGDGRLISESFEPTLLQRLRDRGIAGTKVLLVEDRGAPWDLVAAAGGTDGRARTYDSFVTEEGLLGLAGAVDGVSVGKSRLVGGPGSSTDVAAAGRRAANGAPLQGSELVDAAHAAGLAVYTWTLRPENRFLAQPNRRGTARAAWGDWLGEFTRIIETGLDGIFLDHPDLGIEARRVAAGG